MGILLICQEIYLKLWILINRSLQLQKNKGKRMGKFKTAAVFSNNMVLQREKNICIFGQGEDGQTVKAEFNGKQYQTKVKDEKWSLLLPPMAAGDGYVLTISCGEARECFTNIAIGEVWLAGGQSNMEYELMNCMNGPEMLQNDGEPKVRFYYTNKRSYIDEEFYEDEEKSCWAEFGQESAKHWSAVGYIFAKELAKRLSVTVGVIGCNWGGTIATCWMSEKAIREDNELSVYWDEYYPELEGKSKEQQFKEYKDYEKFHANWEKDYARLYQEDQKISWDRAAELIGACQWPGPKCYLHPFRPSGLYETMLSRVMPYTLRGFIYYQGESDEPRAELYQKQLTRLIRQWREDWHDLELPFLTVQLPMHRYEGSPDNKRWCILREAQMNTYMTVKNTGIAVILDCGEFNEIHPKDKAPVGHRLALQALTSVYGVLDAKEAFGPIYHSFEYKDGGIELMFHYAQDGFITKSDYNGFEIAGDDRIYHPAEFEIRGSGIFVYSKQVTEPVAARYCWSDYSEVPLFGKNGLPLAPFRTDQNI